MRIGLNTFLESSSFTDSDIPLIGRFSEYGAEVIELAIVDPYKVTVSKVLDALRANNLKQPVICGVFTKGRDLRGDKDSVVSSSQYISDLIDLAELLESKVVCGPMYSQTGLATAYSNEERDIQISQIAEALIPLCKKAEEAGVILAIEPLNRFETDCINTLDQAADLIAMVDSPVLKIHMDTFHMNIEEANFEATIIKHARLIGHVHASASHRGLLGHDQVDWKKFFNALKKINYNGDIVIESFTKENKTIAKAASIWRDLYDSPKYLAMEGIAFLHANLY